MSAEDAHWTDRFVGKHEHMADASDVEVASAVRMLSRNDLNHEMIVCAASDRISRLSHQVRDMTQQLAAATAAREQAEAACAVFREAITSNHDVPISLIEGLRSYAATTENAEKAWHEAMVSKLESALSSDSGKSTADELRRLRDENLKLRKILAHVPGRIGLKAKEDAGYGEQIHTKEQP